MSNNTKNESSTFWVSVITAGILACIGGVIYTFFMIQEDAGQEDEYRVVVNDLRLHSQDISAKARETDQGEQAAFVELDQKMKEFSALLGQLDGAGVDKELATINGQWAPIQTAAATLSETGPRVVFIHGVSAELEENIKPIQSEFAAVVDILRDENVSAGTIAAAQKTLWLTERIARNIEKILAGDSESQAAADEFRTDAASFIQIIDALKNSNRVMGVEKLTDPDAVASINTGAELFSVVSTSIDQIAGASAELQEASSARQAMVDSSAVLAGPISDLGPALDRLTNARMFDRGTLILLFGAPALLAVGLLVFMYRSQRQRVLYTEEGVSEINGALVKIAEGDLTVAVPEENSVTRDIAREINASTERQRELIRNIRTPFVVSVEEINKIGKSARGQVNKGKELTNSVVESTMAATEMVRTSDEIKSATVQAAETSSHNREKVASGYELTKDMSSASADVRESVQKTSKSAKRQGELIQSVTTAAEYIQALNTKISVVAINTRIEAEKAGEYGRPFLGIAEAIGDLLREAEEEGRKVISEVRMLQDMSAENLSSMENTVGTVVTILEYIDKLDSSLEDINSGSDAITNLITSVDEAAGQSAESAQHMSSSMARISDRNVDIGELSETTQVGVSNLQKSMRDVAENLSQFKIGDTSSATSYETPISQASSDTDIEEAEDADDLDLMHTATQVYGEAEMSEMEISPEPENKISG
jgi:twitching motility protein PilJ